MGCQKGASSGGTMKDRGGGGCAAMTWWGLGHFPKSGKVERQLDGSGKVEWWLDGSDEVVDESSYSRMGGCCSRWRGGGDSSNRGWRRGWGTISTEAAGWCCLPGSIVGVRGKHEFFFKKRLPMLYSIEIIFYLTMLFKSIRKTSLHFHKANTLESAEMVSGNAN